MDKIKKFLRKLRKNEQETWLLFFMQLGNDYKKIPGLKSLVGKKNWFLIRIGKYRVIFEVMKNKKIEIKKITKRDGNTYKGI